MKYYCNRIALILVGKVLQYYCDADILQEGDYKIFDCKFQRGQDPGDEFRKQTCHGKFVLVFTSIKLFLDLRIINRTNRQEQEGNSSFKEKATGDHLKTITTIDNSKTIVIIIDS